MKKVSIITVNYGGYLDTLELMDSLRTFETYPYELIVVDNASPGEDVQFLSATNDAKVKVIASKKNLGFAGGNNLGFKHAKGDYILFMNNDTLINAPFLEALIHRLESSPTIGLVCPKIKYSYLPDVIQYAGYTEMQPVLIRNHLIGYKQKDIGQFEVAKKTFFAHGACMLTSRAILERVGLMTTIYFLFYEELDWCMRFREAGYEIWYEPITIFHKEGQSISKGSPLRNFYLTRARLFYARRNNKGADIWYSCIYQSTIVFLRNFIGSLLRADLAMASAYARGVYRGLTDPICD